METHLSSKALYVLAISALLSIALCGSTSAANVDTTKGWHTLQQIARTPSDLTRVDNNANGIIDQADTATNSMNSMACSGDSICDVNSLVSSGHGTFTEQINIGGTWAQVQSGTNIDLELKSQGTGDIYLNPGGNVGIGTNAPLYKLDVSGDVRGTRLCIGAICQSSWPTGGAGTVTSVGTGAGLTGGPITTTGTVSADTSYLQRRVTGSCTTGINTIDAAGAVTCAPAGSGGDITGVYVNAGSGLTGGSASGDAYIGTDFNTIQKRVSSNTCAATGIGMINTDGTVACATQTVGDITGVTAGLGLTGGGTSGSVTLDVGAGTGISVAADTISADTAYLQRRVTGTCTTGINTIDAAGAVTCAPAGSGGTITGVTAGAGLTGGGTSGSVNLDVGAGTGISVAANTVGLSYPSKSCASGAINSFDLSWAASAGCYTPALSCRRKSVSGNFAGGYAGLDVYCDPGEVTTGGGCDSACGYIILDFPHVGGGWHCGWRAGGQACGTDQVMADIICCKIV